VPDLQLTPRTPLREQLSPRRIGRLDGYAGISVHERTGLSLALITARRAMRKNCIEKLRAAYDLEPPATTRIIHGRRLSLAWSGPECWLAIASGQPDLETILKTILGNAASVVELTDARVTLRVEGPRTRALLAKGVPIDLHPRVFTPGDTAMTQLAHIAIQLWQVDEKPTFDLVTPRATARDVFHWLTISAAEFGLDVSPVESKMG
jgi:heterotetrameric sarcosine oxidase gamma subunit